MNLQRVSESKLLEILNAELHREGDHQDCWFTSVKLLTEGDENGCNWSGGNLKCSGVFISTCKGDADKIIQKARKEYRIID